MKKIKVRIGILCFPLLMISCSDYLDMPMISTSINQDTIFSKRANAELFLWDVYKSNVPFGIPKYTTVQGVLGGVQRYHEDYDQIERCIRGALTDECNFSQGYAPATEMNLQGYSATNSRLWEAKYKAHYTGIRKAFVFIENIDRASDISQEEKEMMKSECRTLIALRYFTLMRSFGGVPLVKKTLEVNEDFNIQRSSIEDCVNYIVELCDQSMNLPDRYDSKWRGRVTKGVALAVKARTLLYAASPLYNTNEPFIGYGNAEQDALLCYTNTDIERWRTAYEANKAVLDWAETVGNVSIINTGDPFADYGNATSTKDNQEVIFANKVVVNETGFTTHYLPTLAKFNKGNSILVNALYKFYKSDGSEQAWPDLEVVSPFTEYKSKMSEMEARFRVMGWVYGEAPAMCPNRYSWDYNVNGKLSQDVQGAAVMMKWTYNYQGQADIDFPVFRLAEFYLNYAEALNEYSPNDQLAYDALNVIRSRAGLPEISKSDSRYNSQNTFRELIRRERFIELFGEDHRIYDVRRWKIAHTPGVIGGPMLAFGLNQNAGLTNYDSYYSYVFENRYWADKMYYHPFPQNEINKGYLLQNPGY